MKERKSKIMRFDEMCESLFHFYKTTIARRKNKLWEYNGPDTTSSCILATSPPVTYQLTKENFDYRMERYDEHPIQILINAAIQLGIQQGIYMCSEEPSRYLDKTCEKSELDTMLDKLINDSINKDYGSNRD